MLKRLRYPISRVRTNLDVAVVRVEIFRLHLPDTPQSPLLRRTQSKAPPQTTLILRVALVILSMADMNTSAAIEIPKKE